MKTMNIDRLNELEIIDPRSLPPWRLDSFAEIETGSDRETAAQKAETTRSTSDVVVYSDASCRRDHLATAAVALDNNQEIVEAQQVQCSVQNRPPTLKNSRQATDSDDPVRQPVRPAGGSKREKQIRTTHRSRNPPGWRRGSSGGDRTPPSMGLQWVPGHCDNPGIDAADRLAKDAASPGKTHPFRPLLTRERAFIRRNIYSQWEQEWESSTKGGHLRKIDNTLPASYTRRLYGNLPRNRAYLLTQLRTGHNWLSSYRKNVGYSDDDQCACGAQETVTHVLVDCPNLREPRRELRREVGDAFNSVSSLLGGSKQGEKGKPDTVSRARTVNAVLDFAETSQRFRSRAPPGQPNNGNGS
ncbi:hypothetical protein VN97_g12770 [Penicillium thymicola]|uniref:RNase H type-1 domain-containing protein n=1 Tax=Penicillium thymicola TaxID=293382 RepID=A0AAI9T5M4_PENTH|nr:hypothetical protein VN97_g12770 [Penicillium thymicola]